MFFIAYYWRQAVAKLYIGTKNASSWAMRAWLALKFSGYAFETELIDIRRPQRFPNLARLAALSPSVTVPLLDTGRTVIYDSMAIMEFANDVCHGALLPTDIEARAHTRSIVAWQHAGLSSICRSIPFESAFYPIKRRLTPSELAECARLFAHYEELLTRYKGPYLFGSLSLADFMHVPAVIRLTRHRLDMERWPRATHWTQTLLAHSLVDEWMQEADQLPHIWFDEYLGGAPWPAEAGASWVDMGCDRGG